MTRVDHTYQDFSRYLRDGGSIAKRKKSGANFPARLHRLLSDPQFSDAIAWMPHGRAWRIVCKKRLMSEAVPLHFSMTKFESFTRQLSGWGFKRLHRTGADFGGYYHECFLRGVPEITALMTRVPLNCGRPTPSPEDEPNFEQTSLWRPLPPFPGMVANNSEASSSGARDLDEAQAASDEREPVTAAQVKYHASVTHQFLAASSMPSSNGSRTSSTVSYQPSWSAKPTAAKVPASAAVAPTRLAFQDSEASMSQEFLHPPPPDQELHVASSTHSSVGMETTSSFMDTSTVTDQGARMYPVQKTCASARPMLYSAGANATSPLPMNINHSPIQSKMQSNRQHDGDLFSTTQQCQQDDAYDLALFDGTNPFT